MSDTYRTIYHRDGTVTVWDCIHQCWTRRGACDIYRDAPLMSTLSQAERDRITRMAGRAA